MIHCSDDRKTNSRSGRGGIIKILRKRLTVRVMTVAVSIVVSQSLSFAKAPFSCDAVDSRSLNASAIGVSDNHVARVPPASVSPLSSRRVEPALPKKSEDTVPEGLAGSDWNSIRQVYEKNRHAAVAVNGAFRARNPGQQWLTHFDGRGFVVKPDGASWQWGLELQSYGFPGHQRRVSGQANMTADNDRVSYCWHDGLQEWFVNDRNGLEHGFTLNSRPPGAGDPKLGASNHLELRLAVRGGLIAQGRADGLGVSFVNQQGSAVVNYAGLKVWDADKRELDARIHTDAAGLRLTVDERDARYPLTIDPIAQQAYLKASNTGGDDQFGDKVAVSGDTVVVGTQNEDSSSTGVNGNQALNTTLNSGAAYVFVRDVSGVWSQQAYLKASNTDANDRFGYSVAVSDDTVVVGAAGEDSFAVGVNGLQFNSSAIESGAAYVFVRDAGGVWTQQAYLKASNTGADDGFGRTVAVSGDTVVVGASSEGSNATGVNGNQADNSAGFSGAAYVFVRDVSGDWSQQAYLKASNTDVDDRFGWSSAVSGDTVVVGAILEASNATGVNGNEANNNDFESGAAYIFVRDSDGVWSQQAYLKASNTERGRFGESVAVSGDMVVVGVYRAAYAFLRDFGGVWTPRANLKVSNSGIDDQFGYSVAMSGGTVVVGAWREDSKATGVNGDQADNTVSDSGAAYVFVLDGASALLGEPGFSKDRYISIDATKNIVYPVATRVARVGGTEKFLDCTSLTDLGPDGWYAILIDGPLPAAGDPTYYCDLRGVTTGLHMRGCSVLPGNLYDVSMTTDGTTFSSTLSVPTTPSQIGAGRSYGDLVGTFISGVWSDPDGLVTANDIVAVVQKFSLVPGAPILARTDTDGVIPNGIPNGADMLRAVNGFAGVPFGYGVTDCLTGTCVPPVGSCE